MDDSGNPIERYLAATEMRSKAALQLSSYYEKLIILGAGGVAGGATISASLAIKLGRLSGTTLLVEALAQMGIATACAVFANAYTAASSTVDLYFVASYKEDPDEIESLSRRNLLRQAHPFWGRLDRALLRLGRSSGTLTAQRNMVFVSVGISMLLANGFMFYAIFIIENVLRLSR